MNSLSITLRRSLPSLAALSLLLPCAADATPATSVVSSGELAGKCLIYAVNDDQFDFNDPYVIDNSAGVVPGSFSRVAYYVELGDGTPSGTFWVWASMDTFNPSAALVGVPKAGSNIVENGTLVSNLNVETNHPSVTPGTFTDGIIEFWASNYNPNGGGLFGSNNSLFDWKDSGGSTGSGHGSFQVFAFPGAPAAGNAQTLFGITANGGAGIGDQIPNGANGSQDWTFGPGTGSYAVRNLEIWADVPFCVVGDTGSTDEDTLLTVVDPGATTSVLANDVGTGLSVVGFQSTSAAGAVVNVNPDGTFTYDPSGAPALQALTPGQTLDDTFVYTVADGPTPAALGGVSTDLALWLDATDIDGDGFSDTLSDGAPITNWQDKSGNERDADGVLGAPFYVAGSAANTTGAPAVGFSNAQLFTSYNFDNLGANYTIFAVSRYTGGDNERVVTSKTRNWLFGHHGNLDTRWFAEGWINQGGTNNNTAMHLYTGIIGPDVNGNAGDPGADFWKDGVQIVDDNQGSHNTAYKPGAIALGAWTGGGESSNCEVCEVIIYDRALSDTERLDVEAYLEAKYFAPSATVTITVSGVDDPLVAEDDDFSTDEDTPIGEAELNSLLDLNLLASGDYSVTADGETFDARVDHDGTNGWLLVGRGRESWAWNDAGLGLVDDVNDNLGTPAAFAPAYYRSAIINDLIAGAGIDLTDVEIRLKRAGDPDGNTYQEDRWRPTTQTTWRWNFDSAFDVVHEIISGPFGTLGAHAANTRDEGANDWQRVFTWAWGGHNNQQGFSYGQQITNGSNSPTAFLWESGNEQHAIPYTEVYIRVLSAPLPANLLANDSDPDSPISVTAVDTSGTIGLVTSWSANGGFVYDPNGMFESLNVGDMATDSFTYTVRSGIQAAPSQSATDAGIAFAVSNSDLIEGLSAVVTGTSLNGQEGTSNNPAILTNGAFGTAGDPLDLAETVSISNNTTLTYALDTGANPAGYDISSIATYSGWRDAGRDNQNVTLRYATVDAPTTFIDLTTVNLPVGSGGSEVLTSAPGGVLAQSVAAVQFAFGAQENGYVGYRELDVFGAPTDTATATATITIHGVNDAPEVDPTPIPDQLIVTSDPQATVELFEHFEDIDDADNTLTYTVIGNTNPTLIQTDPISSGDGILTINTPCTLIGTADITVEAKDPGGLTVTDTFTVEVKDDVAPEVITPGLVKVLAPAGQTSAVVNFTVTGFDKVDGDNLIIDCTPPSGSVFNWGATTVTCTAEDQSGNLSNTGSFTVVVKLPDDVMLESVSVGGAADGAGGVGDGTYNRIDGAHLTANGKLLVAAEVDLNKGLWSGDITGLSLVGMAPITLPPGGGGEALLAFDRYAVGENGDSGFRARLDGGGEGHWASSGSTLSEVAVIGGAVPGVAGTTFFKLPEQGWALTNSGEYFYLGQMDKADAGINEANNQGIFSDAGGLLIREGSLATSIGGGATYTNFEQQISANDAGQVAFASALRLGTVVSGGDNRAVFCGDPSSPGVVARRGDAAPGAGGAEFDSFLDVGLNAAGECVLFSRLRGAVTPDDDTGLWSDGGGTLTLVAREGAEAPGFGAATTVYESFSDAQITDGGAVVFRAEVRDTAVPLSANENEAIYVWTPGVGVELVAREGGNAPETTGVYINLPSLSVHRGGELGFNGVLQRGVGGVTRRTQHGVWVHDLANAGADPVLLVQAGDPITVGGEEETVTRPSITGGQDGGTAGRSSAVACGNVAVVVTYDRNRATTVFVMGVPDPEVPE